MKIDWKKPFIISLCTAENFAQLRDYLMNCVGAIDLEYKGETYCFLRGWSNEPQYLNKPYSYKEETSGNEKIYIYDTFEDSLYFKFDDGVTLYEFLTGEKPEGPEPTPEIILSKQ